MPDGRMFSDVETLPTLDVFMGGNHWQLVAITIDLFMVDMYIFF